VLLIFSYHTVSDLAIVSQVNSTFWKLSSSNELWNSLYHTTWWFFSPNLRSSSPTPTGTHYLSSSSASLVPSTSSVFCSPSERESSCDSNLVSIEKRSFLRRRNKQNKNKTQSFSTTTSYWAMDLKNCKRKFLENHEMEKTTFGSSHFDSRRTIKKIESALCLMHTICESASFLEINYQITNLLQLCSKFYGGVNLCFSTYRGLINDTKTSAIAKTTSATNTSDFNEGKEKKMMKIPTAILTPLSESKAAKPLVSSSSSYSSSSSSSRSRSSSSSVSSPQILNLCKVGANLQCIMEALLLCSRKRGIDSPSLTSSSSASLPLSSDPLSPFLEKIRHRLRYEISFLILALKILTDLYRQRLIRELQMGAGEKITGWKCREMMDGLHRTCNVYLATGVIIFADC